MYLPLASLIRESGCGGGKCLGPKTVRLYFRRLGLRINGVWPVFLFKTAIFSSNNVIIVVTSRVWPQLRIKTACVLATSVFFLAHAKAEYVWPH